MKLHTLPEETHKALQSLNGFAPLSDFYLSGGTALALHLGHRDSEDLDFFTQQQFNPENLHQKITSLGSISSVYMEENTLNCYLNSVKLQFLYYPYKLLKEPIQWEGIKVSSVIDIACTKLITISMRGSKKDFIDLYFILQHYSLKELFAHAKKKYDTTDYNVPHIMKSLVYFNDAENQPMPRMHESISWEVIKSSIEKEVKNITF